MHWTFLISRFLYERKVDRHRATLAEAIGRRPGCELTVTGHGWPDYDSSLPVVSNLYAAKMAPDVLWVYQDRNDHIHQGVADVDCIRVLLLYDCYDISKRRAEVEAVKPHVIFHTHENDRVRLLEIAPSARRIHVPFGVDKSIFYRPDCGERPIDCLLVGQTHEEIYPLRATWKRLIQSGAIPGEIRTMCSYRLEPAECVRQYAGWGEHMRRAKLVLTGSSIYRYPLQAYYAAAMCGCGVVADMPDDSAFQHGLGRAMYAVDRDDDDLPGKVAAILAAPEEIRYMGMQAMGFAVNHHTTDHMANSMIQAIEAF